MIPTWWRGDSRHAAVRRLLLVPALVFRVTAWGRHTWHALRRSRPLPRPALIVGNLSVGGTGKTPLVVALAREAIDAGARVGVVVHPSASDEARLIGVAVPGSMVRMGRRRRDVAARLMDDGAGLVLFDDGLQHPGLTGARRIAVVAVEQERWSRWRIPAGPWREGRDALRRCDLIVVTRKTAAPAAARALAAELTATTRKPVAVAALRLQALTGLHGGRPMPLTTLAGRSVLAVAGVADPEPFRQQLDDLGARVTLRAFRDHHRYRPSDMAALLEESRRNDYVVCTSKDAVKLLTCWPAEPEPLVAELVVHWEAGRDAVSAELRCVLPEQTRKRNPRQAAAGIS